MNYFHPKYKLPLENFGNFLLEPRSGDKFPVIRGIPRFCAPDNYSQSFGFQWSIFSKTQLDCESDSRQSSERFYQETGWKPADLSHLRVLEIGSGAGRFSEVFLRTTPGILYSIDYSNAVEANMENNRKYSSRFHLAQASIYEMPFADNSFDRAFCLGVLQHTPSFEGSIVSIIEKVRSGGQIVVDFYPIKGWYTKIHSKYILRPLTKKIPKNKLLKIIRTNIGWLLNLFDFLCLVRLGVLTRFLPITDVRLFPRSLTEEQRREWAIMDTFDAFSPQYDNPQKIRDVVRMFETNGCEVKFSGLINIDNFESAVVRAEKK